MNHIPFQIICLKCLPSCACTLPGTVDAAMTSECIHVCVQVWDDRDWHGAIESVPGSPVPRHCGKPAARSIGQGAGRR